MFLTKIEDGQLVEIEVTDSIPAGCKVHHRSHYGIPFCGQTSKWGCFMADWAEEITCRKCLRLIAYP